MSEITDQERIKMAFRQLRKNGWFARMKFYCCGSCGSAAVPEKYKDKFVFYHAQDADSIEDGNITDGGMYLCHGEGGNTTEILEALNTSGLNVEWDGDMDTRILVKHKA